MKQNVLLMHGGGPSAVINASLYGAIAEAKQHDCVGRVYGAYGGASGLLAGKLIDFYQARGMNSAIRVAVAESSLKKVSVTGSIFGSTPKLVAAT
ncbi:MAG: hypothetical protein EOM69_11140 [Clostridia bacterium]|nr:hypothetical protein [Clostridia bacterium]